MKNNEQFLKECEAKRQNRARSIIEKCHTQGYKFGYQLTESTNDWFFLQEFGAEIVHNEEGEFLTAEEACKNIERAFSL